MTDRRKFIKVGTIGSLALITGTSCQETEEIKEEITGNLNAVKPIAISTWNHGVQANEAAWKILAKKGSALDAVEAGVRVTESDPENMSVGLGGLPDREGKVTLDACIMNHNNECGSVAFLQEIENPISVARKVMEETEHVMLVGEGAKQFALSQGFTTKNLLTEAAKKRMAKVVRDFSI